jgi:hypothetical protein
MTVGHRIEGLVSCVSCGPSGDPPRNAWCRTIAHIEDIFLQCYSTQPYFPCYAESELSGRIPWHACAVPLMDSWAVSRCTRFFSRTLRLLYEWPERKSGQNCTDGTAPMCHIFSNAQRFNIFLAPSKRMWWAGERCHRTTKVVLRKRGSVLVTKGRKGGCRWGSPKGRGLFGFTLQLSNKKMLTGRGSDAAVSYSSAVRATVSAERDYDYDLCKSPRFAATWLQTLTPFRSPVRSSSLIFLATM